MEIKFLRFILKSCVISITSISCTNIYSEPTGSEKNDFLYVVRRGDSLYELAAEYMQNHNKWPILQTLNQVPNPRRLIPGTTLHIPLSLIPQDQGEIKITDLHGEITLNGNITTNNQPLRENDILSLGKNSSATVEFSDGSRVGLLSETTIVLRQIKIFSKTKLLNSIIFLQKGQVTSNVSPKHSGIGRFEIRTPIATTGVRGTRFHLDYTGKTLKGEVDSGKVKVENRLSEKEISSGSGFLVADEKSNIQIQERLPAPRILKIERVNAGHYRVMVEKISQAIAYKIYLSDSNDLTSAFYSKESVLPVFDIRLSEERDAHLFVCAKDAVGICGQTNQASVAALAIAPAPAKNKGQIGIEIQLANASRETRWATSHSNDALPDNSQHPNIDAELLPETPFKQQHEVFSATQQPHPVSGTIIIKYGTVCNNDLQVSVTPTVTLRQPQTHDGNSACYAIASGLKPGIYKAEIFRKNANDKELIATKTFTISSYSFSNTTGKLFIDIGLISGD